MNRPVLGSYHRARLYCRPALLSHWRPVYANRGCFELSLWAVILPKLSYVTWLTTEVVFAPELYWATSRIVPSLSARSQKIVPAEFSSANTWSTAGPER